jgi:hypothetical protein
LKCARASGRAATIASMAAVTKLSAVGKMGAAMFAFQTSSGDGNPSSAVGATFASQISSKSAANSSRSSVVRGSRRALRPRIR